jgi:hypothetical protein
MLYEFHYLKQQYVMRTNHTHFITSLILDPIPIPSGLRFHGHPVSCCVIQFTNHVCVGTTQNTNIYDIRKEVKWVEKKEGGERGPITNMGIATKKNNIMCSAA